MAKAKTSRSWFIVNNISQVHAHQSIRVAGESTARAAELAFKHTTALADLLVKEGYLEDDRTEVK